ncbi:hypothetical protein [Acinetobacter phage vB_AbaS_TCUP2199]|nr:hypothetical protein [Acinetobacter phage vB_AbaS_TCUP2199]
MYRIDLEKSPRAKKLLQAQVGEKTDLSQFAVFELRANDTLPITRAGGALANARMTQTYLNQMAENINLGNYVPLIELHDTHSRLPIGRTLDAKVYDSEGNFNEKELRVLVYLQADHEHAAKIDSGIINEVSTGTTPSSVKCSACDFDFMASPDNRRKLYAGKDYTPLCDNGHQWGMNGNHLRLDGVKQWREISVVPRGAAPNAQVIKAENALLAAETGEINLSGDFSTDILLSTTAGAVFLADEIPKNSGTPNIPNTGAKMDITLSQDKYDKFVKAEAKVDLLEAQLSAANESVTKAETAKQEAETAKQKAEADLAAKETELETEKTAKAEVEAKLTAAEAKLAVYEAGGNPEGSAGGAQGGEGDDTNLSQPVLDNSFFKASK